VLFWRASRVPFEVYCPVEYCVLTHGSDDDPRTIMPPVRVEREMLRPKYFVPAVIQGQPVDVGIYVGLSRLISAPGPSFIGAPVLLHGNTHLHWKDSHQKILVFDTVAESFWHMRPPAVNSGHIMQLFDMDGMLAASSSKDTMAELRIFGLQDYKSDVWSFQYGIKLPVMEIRCFQEQGDWLAKIVSEKGDLLVSCFGWLLHCDRKGNLVTKFRFDDDFPVVIRHLLKESLSRAERKPCSTSIFQGLILIGSLHFVSCYM
jgi:hypothetical protein